MNSADGGVDDERAVSRSDCTGVKSLSSNVLVPFHCEFAVEYGSSMGDVAAHPIDIIRPINNDATTAPEPKTRSLNVRTPPVFSHTPDRYPT